MAECTAQCVLRENSYGSTCSFVVIHDCALTALKESNAGSASPFITDKPKNQEVSVKRKWTRPRCCFGTPSWVCGSYISLPSRAASSVPCSLWEEGRGGTPLEKERGA